MFKGFSIDTVAHLEDRLTLAQTSNQRQESEFQPIQISTALIGPKHKENHCSHESSYESDHSYYFAVENNQPSEV